MRDEDRKDFAAFLAEFQDETDRGAALVGAALIDQKLADTLQAFMVKSKLVDELINGGDAPLGSLSARTKAAFALGLIDSHELHECDIIRKVRNEFAHRAHGISFADGKIRRLCDRLKSDLPGSREVYAGNPRGVFVNAVVLTVVRLTYRAEFVASEQRTTKTWPY